MPRTLIARATRVAILAFVTSGCNSVRVQRVDYSFNTPIVTLPLGMPSPSDQRDAFTQVFCKALAFDHDYAGKPCTNFLEIPGFTSDGTPIPPLRDDYQIIVVAGIFSACLPRDQISIFKQGIAQLKQEGLTHVDEIPVSATGGTDDHAKTISAYIRSHHDANRRFIAIGYSQGAADLLQAYVSDDVVQGELAALITVAGAVGGSRLADGLPRALSQVLSALNLVLPDCQISGVQGLDALRRDVRYDFLDAHRDRLPRAYSVAAKSSKEITSNILQNAWTQLTAYSIDEDSQVIRDDAVVPGGAFLATARADHWAVTLPFKEAHNPVFDDLVNHNDFPRTALLEALIRYVMKDLQDHP